MWCILFRRIKLVHQITIIKEKVKMKLESERIYLRPLCELDAPIMLEIHWMKKYVI